MKYNRFFGHLCMLIAKDIGNAGICLSLFTQNLSFFCYVFVRFLLK